MKRANVKLTIISDSDLRALKAMQQDRDNLNRLQPYDQEDPRIPADAEPIPKWIVRLLWLLPWAVVGLTLYTAWLTWGPK